MVSANAQSDKYVTTMKKNLAMFDSVKTTTEYQSLSASFERIGDAEKAQWLPYYYAALALTTPGWQDTKLDKDVNAEKIKALCDKADALAKENADKSEILSIRNMAATQQMLVDPQTRWANYGQESDKYLVKAKAKPILEKAIALYKAEQPKPLYPHWGQKQAEDMLAQCQ